MISFSKKAAAIPTRLAAMLAEALKSGNALSLWSVTFNLSHSVSDGCKLLFLTYQQEGIDSARASAANLLEQTRHSNIATTIGYLEISSGNTEAARDWINQAGRLECESPEMMLGLELFIAEDDSESEILISQILARDDLPMEFTRNALTRKMWKLAEKRDWEQAEQISNRILGVEENVDARLIKWMGCESRQQHAQAEKHLAFAQSKLPEPVFNMLMAQGWLFLDNPDKAMEWTYKAEQSGIKINELDSEIGDLARSEEFRKYCRERN